MTNEEFEHIVDILTEWKLSIVLCMQQLEELGSITGVDYESPLPKRIIELESYYTKAVAELVGDASEWLEYYRDECNMGERTPEVYVNGGWAVTLDSVMNLAKVVCWDRLTEEQRNEL